MSTIPTVYEMLPVMTLWRYFSWCQWQRTFADAFKVTWETNFFDSVEIQQWFMHLSYWYSGLYVVCEGWQELRLTDPDVDRLLQSPYLDVLRRYRNGVFHYQPEYLDIRIKEAIQSGEPFQKWVDDLMQHFKRYLDDWFAKHRPLIRQMKSESTGGPP